MASQQGLLSVKPLERRRSPRFLHTMPLFVRGESQQRKPFWDWEETVTISISAHGALVNLATKVKVGQTLSIINPQNWDERTVRVVLVGSAEGDRRQVGISFVSPAPDFWPAGAIALRRQ